MKPVSADYICRDFVRSPFSLIEEPEVCESCAFYEDGFCRKTEDDYEKS